MIDALCLDMFNNNQLNLFGKIKNYKNSRWGTIEIARRVGISSERLRYWERKGIVNPKYIRCGTRNFREYSEEDIHRAILIKALIDTGKYTLKSAIKKLREER